MYAHDIVGSGPHLSVIALVFLFIAAVWTITLKGYALWYSARNSQKWWFIALLIVNTLGILELVYLIWFRPKSATMQSAAPMTSSSAAAK